MTCIEQGSEWQVQKDYRTLLNLHICGTNKSTPGMLEEDWICPSHYITIEWEYFPYHSTLRLVMIYKYHAFHFYESVYKKSIWKCICGWALCVAANDRRMEL